jgi:hypothetical protein
MPSKQLPKTEHIYRVEHYRDEYGRNVQEHVIVSDKLPPPGYCRFQGRAHVELNTGQVLPNGRPHIVGLDLDFPIPAADIDQAFEMFDESIEPGINAWMEKQRERAVDAPRILRPGVG